MTVLVKAVARRIAGSVNREWGENVCNSDDVIQVFNGGTLGLGDRSSVESRILQAIEEAGFEPNV